MKTVFINTHYKLFGFYVFIVFEVFESHFCFVTYFSGCTHDKYRTCMKFISTTNSNLSGVLDITKKSLNRLTGHCLVPIQEAVHEIAGLDLVICSDNLYSFSLGKANALIKMENKLPTTNQT